MDSLRLPLVALISVDSVTIVIYSIPSLAFWHARLGHTIILKIEPGQKPFLPPVPGSTRFLTGFEGFYQTKLVPGSWLNQSDRLVRFSF